MFEKVDVKDAGQHAVYRFLTENFEVPDWNFAKYLVGRDGKVIKRYSPTVKPEDGELISDIEAALDA